MNNEFLIFLTEIAFPLVFSVFSLYVAPTITSFINENQLNQAVDIAVIGVEQYMTTAEGSAKKQAVKDYVLSKFELSDDQLDILIEAAVFELNN